MSNYEFWDELGKIFNAVVAYQEKSIEFNKRFINPWIRVGNVFDKQDRNKEAINAYKKAIEIDPNNAQNWCELGNIYFKMEDFDEAVEAFNKAIELEPGFGWSYCNLGLTFVSQGNYAKAIPLYSKSIDLLEEKKDKAVAWNRLGNVYRKINEYSLAVEAFQKADEFDEENAGFRDDLDEESEGPSLVEGSDEESAQSTGATLNPIEFLAGSQVEEETSADSDEVEASEDTAKETEPVEQPEVAASVADAESPSAEAIQPEAEAVEAAPAEDSQAEAPVAETDTAVEETPEAPTEAVSETSDEIDASAELPVTDEVEDPVEESGEDVIDVIDEPEAEAAPEPEPETEAEPGPAIEAQAEAPVDAEEPSAQEVVSQTVVTSEESDQPEEAPAGEEPTVTAVMQETVETYTETIEVTDAQSESSEAAESPEEVPASTDVATKPASHIQEALMAEVPQDAEAVAGEEINAEESTPVELVAEETASEETESKAKVEADAPGLVVQAEADEAVEEVVDQENVNVPEETDEIPASVHAAYEEFLKDNEEQLNISAVEANQEPAEAEEPAASPEPVAKINEAGDVQIEMDAKNAHVWNELGNVYYNTGAFDDAIVAYSKAIDLDRWFAWPYSNLALAYVQKGRFAEAILLYQRSIELFKSEKDKAISWNRLGNVYRRLNDYDNAIAAYQRADELDPDNTTLSLQSRFSLLGSFAAEQKPSYVS